MIPRILMAVLLTVFGSSFVYTASASTELRWLNYSPIRFFTDKDWDLAKGAAREALNNASDGQKVEWRNPDSDNYGSLTPVSTMTKDGRTCRNLQIRNHANNLDGGGTYEFCQRADGTWGATKGLPGQ